MASFSTKDGIESLCVRMDRMPPIYRAGDILQGKIIVICNATTPVKGIKVSIQGGQMKIGNF